MLLEQDIGFEPMTFSLATKHSTTELILHSYYLLYNNIPYMSNYAARMYDLYLSAAYDAANAFGFTNGTTLHIPLM